MSAYCFFEDLYYYSVRIIIPLGIIFNSLCTIVFVKILRKNNNTNLFRYLLIKSVCEFIYFILYSPTIMYYHKNGDNDRSYILQLWRQFIRNYVMYVFEMMIGFLDIFASLDCLLMFSKLTFYKKKLTFYLITGISFIFGFLFYIVSLFKFHITSKYVKSKKNKTILVEQFYFKRTEFQSTTFSRYHLFIHNIFRDMLPLVSLFIINILLFIWFRNVTEKRKSLNNSKSKMIILSKKAETKRVKMILFASAVYLLHVPIIIKNFFNFGDEACWKSITFIAYDLSLCLPLILYIRFNKVFELFFKKLFFSVKDKLFYFMK
jgi:hypothetical protein